MAEDADETPGLTYWYDASTHVLSGEDVAAASESVLANQIISAVVHARSVATQMGVPDPEVRVIIRTEWTKPIAPVQETTDGD